jgi:hypothetical protein
MAVTRRGLCGGAMVAAATGAVAVPMIVQAQGDAEDARVLDLLLLVERTEAAFYSAALESGILDGELLEFAETVVGHEREHLAVVEGAVEAPQAAPEFEFGENLTDASAFARAAARLEDAAVGAYNGQAGNVSTKVFTVAARIVSVEARHAAWVRSIENRDPAPDATDRAWTEDQVRVRLREIGGTG